MNILDKGGRTLLLAAIVVLAGFAGYWYTTNVVGTPGSDGAIERSSELGAVISYTEGAVELKQSGSDWTRAEGGTVLREGDSVEVIGEGRAIIQLDDGSMLRLNEDSAITLTSLDPSHVVVSNDKGEVYSRVVKADRVFQVLADDATYESLGTAYSTVNKDKQKGVKVYHSKVKVVDGDDETVVDQGKKFFLVYKDNPELEKALADITEEEIKVDVFIAWNKSEDEKDFDDELGVLSKDVDKEGAEEDADADDESDDKAAEPTPGSGIALTYNLNGNISWVYNGTSEDGFKIVWSKNPSPTYPTRSGDKYIYLSESDARGGTLKAFDGGGKYYVRVCEYLGGKCGVYSNQITVQL